MLLSDCTELVMGQQFIFGLLVLSTQLIVWQSLIIHYLFIITIFLLTFILSLSWFYLLKMLFYKVYQYAPSIQLIKTQVKQHLPQSYFKCGVNLA